MIGLCSLALLASCAVPPPGDSAPGGESPPEIRLGWDPASIPALQDAPTDPPWSIQGQVETGQTREKILNSHNNLGLSRENLEQGLRFTDVHDLALLRAGFDIPLGGRTEFKLHGAGGAERIGTSVKAGAENPVFGDPAGTTDTDFAFNLAPVWDAGAEFRLGFGDGPLDVAATFDARGGGDSEKDAATDEHYHYERYRVGLFAGLTFGVFRPYAGAQLSYYRARFEVTDLGSGANVRFQLGYKDELNAAVGFTLSSGTIVGGVEVEFVGTITALASVGVRF